MDWKKTNKALGVNDMDEDTSPEARRAMTAYWAYSLLTGAFDRMKGDLSRPDIIAVHDQRRTATSDVLRSCGIDLSDPAVRDSLVIFCTMLHQICDGEEEIASFTMTVCELAVAMHGEDGR